MSKLKLVKSEMNDNWYTIELAEHPNKVELRAHKAGYNYLWYSGRICDSDVEGTAEEMRDIAQAIRDHSTFSHKRCAVCCGPNSVAFWSPRNSEVSGNFSKEDAEDLASQIEAQLRG